MFDTVWKKPDSTIGADILAMLQETPNMLVVWRPDLRKYNAVRLREVPTWVPPTGAEIQIDMPMLLASAFGVSLRAWEVRGRGRNGGPGGDSRAVGAVRSPRLPVS